MQTSIESVLNAFVEDLWTNDGVDASKARARFFREHNLLEGDVSTIPHYCDVCGTLNSVEIPR